MHKSIPTQYSSPLILKHILENLDLSSLDITIIILKETSNELGPHVAVSP